MRGQKKPQPLPTDHLELLNEDITGYLEPLGMLVLVRPMRRHTATPAGIVLPPEVIDAFTLIIAEVIAVGPGSKNDDGDLIPMTEIAVGDVVAYAKRTKQIPVQFSKLATPDGDQKPTAVLVQFDSLLAKANLPDAAFTSKTT